MTMLKMIVRHCPNSVLKFFCRLKMGSFTRKGFHTLPRSVSFENMKVKILPALQDNYMYLIIDENTRKAAIIDPVEPETVVEAVTEENVTLTTVLTTHHHWDHAGGNKKLVKMLPTLEVVGGDKRIDALTRIVSDNDAVKIGSLNVTCLYTPCHTKGHICYYIKLEDEPSAVFTGDTLFTAGCGRFFEGTAEEMYTALIEKLGTLPESTKVFCGHEYTINNLKFAKKVEPNNPHINKRLQWAQQQRLNNIPTIPSTIGEEKLTNPFMRVHDVEIQEFAKDSDPINAMRVLRHEKDNFKAL